jgi:hypothetical protein
LTSRAAKATLIPSFLNNLAKDALNPGPAPTINAISDCAMNSPFVRQMMIKIFSRKDAKVRDQIDSDKILFTLASLRLCGSHILFRPSPPVRISNMFG